MLSLCKACSRHPEPAPHADGVRRPLQHALKIDKLDRRKDPRGGTVKAEHKVREVDRTHNQTRGPMIATAPSHHVYPVRVQENQPMSSCACLAQVLAQLQECTQVCRLVPNGEGTWEGRSYLLMELLGLNLAMYQRAHPHNGRINPTRGQEDRCGLQSIIFPALFCIGEMCCFTGIQCALHAVSSLAHQRLAPQAPVCTKADRHHPYSVFRQA